MLQYLILLHVTSLNSFLLLKKMTNCCSHVATCLVFEQYYCYNGEIVGRDIVGWKGIC